MGRGQRVLHKSDSRAVRSHFTKQEALPPIIGDVAPNALTAPVTKYEDDVEVCVCITVGVLTLIRFEGSRVRMRISFAIFFQQTHRPSRKVCHELFSSLIANGKPK